MLWKAPRERRSRCCWRDGARCARFVGPGTGWQPAAAVLQVHSCRKPSYMVTHPVDQETRDDIGDQGDDEHQQAGLDHRREEEARGGFAELGGDGASERVAVIQETRGYGRRLVAEAERE